MMPVRQTVLLIIFTLLTNACDAKVVNPTVTPVLQQLRVENTGTQDIEGLTILFPGPVVDSAALRVEFGDVSPGVTTEYQIMPGGVYQYAAYEYFWSGRLVRQFVIDWLSESPMPGEKFTYRILLDIQKVAGDQIQLVDVLVDIP